jgi:hypothetical protein
MGGQETWEQLSGPLGRVLEQIRARAEGSGRAVASSVETGTAGPGGCMAARPNSIGGNIQ